MTHVSRLVVAWSPQAARTAWACWPDRPDDLAVVPFDFNEAIEIVSVDRAGGHAPVWRVQDQQARHLTGKLAPGTPVTLLVPARQPVEWAGSLLADHLVQRGHPVTRLAPPALTTQDLRASKPGSFDKTAIEREWRVRLVQRAVHSFLNPAIKRATGLATDLDLDQLTALAIISQSNDQDLQALHSFRKNDTEWPVVDALSAVAMSPDLPAGQPVELYDRLVDGGLVACLPEHGDPDSFPEARNESLVRACRQARSQIGQDPEVGFPWLVDPGRDLAGIPPDVRPAYLAVWRRAMGIPGPVPPGRLGRGSLPHVWTAARSCMTDRRWWRALNGLRSSGLVAGWSWPACTATGRLVLAAVRTSWSHVCWIPDTGPQIPAFSQAVERAILHGSSRTDLLDAVAEAVDRGSTNRMRGPTAGPLCRACRRVPAIKPDGRDVWLTCACGQREPADVTDGIVWPVRDHSTPGWCRVHGVEVLHVTVNQGVKTVHCKRCTQEKS